MRGYPIARVAILMVAMVMGNVAHATERSPLVSGPDLQLPSIWRLLTVFIFIGALGYLATLLLKRIRPWLSSQGIVSDSQPVKLISHRKLSRSLNVYVIDAENQRFMLVQSPQSTAVTRLDGRRDGDETRSVATD